MVLSRNQNSHPYPTSSSSTKPAAPSSPTLSVEAAGAGAPPSATSNWASLSTAPIDPRVSVAMASLYYHRGGREATNISDAATAATGRPCSSPSLSIMTTATPAAATAAASGNENSPAPPTESFTASSPLPARGNTFGFPIQGGISPRDGKEVYGPGGKGAVLPRSHIFGGGGRHSCGVAGFTGYCSPREGGESAVDVPSLPSPSLSHPFGGRGSSSSSATADNRRCDHIDAAVTSTLLSLSTIPQERQQQQQRQGQGQHHHHNLLRPASLSNTVVGSAKAISVTSTRLPGSSSNKNVVLGPRPSGVSVSGWEGEVARGRISAILKTEPVGEM